MKTEDYFTQRIRKQLIKEDLGECWIWIGATNAKGYGIFCDRSEAKHNRSAHRDFYELITKTKIENFACHTCDQPSCINPNHIYDGTSKENKADAIRRQRISPKKLTKEKIEILLKGFHEGKEQKDIAKDINVNRATVMRFLNGQLNQHTHNYIKEVQEKRNTLIKDLFAQGKSLSVIMLEAKVPASVVWDVIPEIKGQPKGKESNQNLIVKANLGIEERNKQIRDKNQQGQSVIDLAREYGVSKQLVYKIIR